MELRPLRSFIAAAEDGNISRAAARLHLTQPALSRQIKGLEDELGVGLLERGAHSFSLTPAGELLLKEGRVLLERADALEQRVRATAKAQTIRVGYSPSLSAGILSPAMEAFSQVHPKARVELSDLANQEMMDGLIKGSLDVIVTVPPVKDMPDILWTTVQRQAWRVALPRQHPLQAKKILSPQDLHEQRLVVYNQRDYPDYWAFIGAWFKEHRINARIASECDGVTSLISAVEAGIGIALVVERIACLIPERIVLKPLSPQPQPIHIAVGVLDRQKNDKVFAVFVEELKRAGELDLGRPGI
ncbi:LysR substrate-binding domain-containing protein [Prosthecobacter sp. SYSU 5D2]|uniref:LysR family transcriptional regulator n=1 Tax=Prosthecobacter sp. SYSU 5D2 TaxID=3134134 RepID=UPI0031FF1EA5